MSSQRVADYFIVAGMPQNPSLLENASNEASMKPNHKREPITDICVIIPNQGEDCPPG